MKSIEPRTTRPRTPQPIEAANNPAALLRLETVQALIGMSRSTIYAWVAEGRFVQPIRRGPRCTRWRAGDVQAWLEAEANK